MNGFITCDGISYSFFNPKITVMDVPPAARDTSGEYGIPDECQQVEFAIADVEIREMMSTPTGLLEVCGLDRPVRDIMMRYILPVPEVRKWLLPEGCRKRISLREAYQMDVDRFWEELGDAARALQAVAENKP